MKRNGTRLAAMGLAAALLVGGMSVSPAWAYFTDSHGTEGGVRLALAPETEIQETYGEKTKHVRIWNTSKSVPVFVRVRVFSTDDKLTTIEGNWSDPDAEGWRYWNGVLEPGAPTDELTVGIEFPEQTSQTVTYPDGTSETYIIEDHTGENFNVAVVYEAVPVRSGQTDPQQAEWPKA